MTPLNFDCARPYAHELLDLQAAPLDALDDYQCKALRTESPMTDAVMTRFYLVRDELANKLIYLKREIENLSLDKLKKFVFYGKVMTDRPDILHPENLTLTDVVPTPRLATLESDLPELIRMVRYIHGLLGEITEIEEKLEALTTFLALGDLTSFDRVNALEESGDGMWYQALQVDALGGSLSGVADKNIAKLAKRYPEKFTDHHAQNRDLPAEREILEFAEKVANSKPEDWQSEVGPPMDGMGPVPTV